MCACLADGHMSAHLTVVHEALVALGVDDKGAGRALAAPHPDRKPGARIAEESPRRSSTSSMRVSAVTEIRDS